jgi:hypothetical protein
VCRLRRLLLIIVGRRAALIRGKIWALAVKLDRHGWGVVARVLLIWWRGTKVLGLAIRCSVDRWIVRWRILPTLGRLLRFRVSDRGVNEETHEASTV